MCVRNRGAAQSPVTAPADVGPMSKDVEPVLFRILQESLTNIHRPAGSASAEVRLFSASGKVMMEVQDRGIQAEFAERMGIGQNYLSNMRRGNV
jgi:signal transduction histidine kinase